MMKILFLSAANSIHTVKWINALASRGHEVYLGQIQGNHFQVHDIFLIQRSYIHPPRHFYYFYLNRHYMSQIHK